MFKDQWKHNEHNIIYKSILFNSHRRLSATLPSEKYSLCNKFVQMTNFINHWKGHSPSLTVPTSIITDQRSLYEKIVSQNKKYVFEKINPIIIIILTYSIVNIELYRYSFVMIQIYTRKEHIVVHKTFI